MGEATTYSLRLPKSLKDQVAKAAKRDHTSMNQFIAIAVAEKISALEIEDFFTKRAEKANLKGFKSLLLRSGGEKPRVGDEV